MSDSGHSAYREAGVDIDAQDEALSGIGELVRSTFTSGVLSELGSFGGLFQPSFEGMEAPVLVSSADGVGTKLAVAKAAGDYSTVGGCLVNHCVNDILVQGAQPLFFMDYVGAGVLEAEPMHQLVSGVAEACRANGCALLGGETAEMPGFYQPGDYELVGFVVGLVDRTAVLDGSRVCEGDVLLGLPSSGLHTNGYSLARRAFFDLGGASLETPLIEGSDRTVGEELLEQHVSYLPALGPLIGDPGLHALAHITGGGLTDNLPRVLPQGHRALIDESAWQVPAVFQRIRELAGVSDAEMFRVFNMGIGMVAIVAPDRVAHLEARLPESVRVGVVEAIADTTATAHVAYRGH
ncbi:MAG: phosphoribosylformylglycinamidine cyclo-ligase [Acidobacteriota bacterium]